MITYNLLQVCLEFFFIVELKLQSKKLNQIFFKISLYVTQILIKFRLFYEFLFQMVNSLLFIIIQIN